VSRAAETVQSVVTSARYKAQLSDDTYSELANRLLCWSILQETVGEVSEAGWASLHAAWACDDRDATRAAQECRLRAVQLFRAARERRLSFAPDVGAEEAVLADILRRAHNHDEVQKVCEEGLATKPGDVIRKVLRYQMQLAAAGDANRHTIEEAVAVASE